MVALLDAPKLQRYGCEYGSEQQTEVRRTVSDRHGLECASFAGQSTLLWHGSIQTAGLEVDRGRLHIYSQHMRQFVR